MPLDRSLPNIKSVSARSCVSSQLIGEPDAELSFKRKIHFSISTVFKMKKAIFTAIYVCTVAFAMKEPLFVAGIVVGIMYISVINIL